MSVSLVLHRIYKAQFGSKYQIFLPKKTREWVTEEKESLVFICLHHKIEITTRQYWGACHYNYSLEIQNPAQHELYMSYFKLNMQLVLISKDNMIFCQIMARKFWTDIPIALCCHVMSGPHQLDLTSDDL